MNGLHLSIQSIVARFCESQTRPTLTYHHFVQYSSDEGEAFRVQSQVIRRIRTATRARITGTLGVNFLTKSILNEILDFSDFLKVTASSREIQLLTGRPRNTKSKSTVYKSAR